MSVTNAVQIRLVLLPVFFHSPIGCPINSTLAKEKARSTTISLVPRHVTMAAACQASVGMSEYYFRAIRSLKETWRFTFWLEGGLNPELPDSNPTQPTNYCVLLFSFLQRNCLE